MDFRAIAIVRHVRLVLVCVEEILILLECVRRASPTISLSAVRLVSAYLNIFRIFFCAGVLVAASRVFFINEVFISVESQRLVTSLISLNSAVVVLPDSEYIDSRRVDVIAFVWAEVHLRDLPELYLLIGVHCEHAFERHL